MKDQRRSGYARNVSSYIIYRRKRFRKRCCFNYGWTFSGATRGIAVGHISPEAASGGPIGLIRDGDEITIDLVNRTLDVNQPQEELYKRKEELEPFKAKVKQVILQDTLL